MEARHDDDKALEPHADVHDHRDHEEQNWGGSHFSEPEPLRCDDVAEDQRPVHVPIGSGHPVPDHEPFVLVRAEPTEEGFRDVPICHDEAGHEGDLCHVFKMADREEVLESVNLAQRDRKGEDHREAGVDGARHEIWGKYRRVPSRYDADREVEADDGVDREHQRRRKTREQQVDVLVALPVPRRSAPAEREHAVGSLHPEMTSLVAKRRHVGNHADIPEQQRYREVRRDSEHVPDERASELRPDRHAVRIGEQPVGRCSSG